MAAEAHPTSVKWTKRALHDLVQQRLGDRLFMVVSNREPYLHRFSGSEIVCEVPVGGLTTALDPVMRACGGIWVAHGAGEADRRVVDRAGRVAVPPEEPAYTLRRVWLTDDEENGYYHGFANGALWPLCHVAYTKPVFESREWEQYQAVNQKFADAVLDEIGTRNAFVFIQDYHLALLSRLLKRPNIRTAQFWHVPWPNPEAFGICPWASEIVDGLLGNDLLGFHIPYHCQNFLDTVDRILEAKVDREHSTVTRGGLTTRVRPFPISVDFGGIASRAAGHEVEAEMARLRRACHLEGKTIGLGVDRVDYTKGIPERLRAVDRMLDRHPRLQGKFVFVEIGVPSRMQVATYQQVAMEIDKTVAAVNWNHREGDWRPVLHLKGAVSPTTLLAWYRLAHLCVVSSLHDGMNLIAKEYCAARVADDGVLILSPFTGASRALADAQIVNPYDIDALAQAIFDAIRMPAEEQARRMRKLREQVQEHNIFRWAAAVLSQLFEFEFSEA